MELIIWKLIGIRESSLAEKIEPLIEKSNITVGYRPHVPYIELKLWVNVHDKSKEEKCLNEIRKIIEPWYICDGNFNPYNEFCKINRNNILLIDKATQGLFARKLRPFLKQNETTIIGKINADIPTDKQTTLLEITEVSNEGIWAVNFNGQIQKLELPFQYRQIKSDIKDRFVCEITILTLLKKWNNNDKS